MDEEWILFEVQTPEVFQDVIAFQGEPFIEDHTTVVTYLGNGKVLNLQSDLEDFIADGYYMWKPLPSEMQARETYEYLKAKHDKS